MNAASFGDSEEVLLVASELDGNAMIGVRGASMQYSGIAHASLERAGLNVYLAGSVGKKDRGYMVQDELVTRCLGEVWQWLEELSHDESLVIVHCKSLPSLGMKFTYSAERESEESEYAVDAAVLLSFKGRVSTGGGR